MNVLRVARSSSRSAARLGGGHGVADAGPKPPVAVVPVAAGMPDLGQRVALERDRDVDHPQPELGRPGGQSPMYTFIEHEALHRLVASFHDAGKVTAAVCHATCVLLKVKGADGKLLVDGKTWCGFADAEERYADEFVGQKIQPFWIEEEARKLPNTNFVVGPTFSAFAVRDGLLVTGQQQFSGAAAAALVVEAVGR